MADKRQTEVGYIGHDLSGNVAGENIDTSHHTTNINQSVVYLSIVAITIIFTLAVVLIFLLQSRQFQPTDNVLRTVNEPPITSEVVPTSPIVAQTLPTPTKTPRLTPTPITVTPTASLPASTSDAQISFRICINNPEAIDENTTITVTIGDDDVIILPTVKKGCIEGNVESFYDGYPGLLFISGDSISFQTEVDIWETTIYITLPPTSTPLPTNTQTQVPTLSPTPTSTYTPSSTPTLTPTSTSTPTLTPTSTSTPTLTPTSTSTPANAPSPTVTNTTSLSSVKEISIQIDERLIGPTSGTLWLPNRGARRAEVNWYLKNWSYVMGSTLTFTTYVDGNLYTLRENEYYNLDFLGISINRGCLGLKVKDFLAIPNVELFKTIYEFDCKGEVVQGNSYEMILKIVSINNNEIKQISPAYSLNIIVK